MTSSHGKEHSKFRFRFGCSNKSCGKKNCDWSIPSPSDCDWFAVRHPRIRFLFLIMDWGSDLWDQHDVIERHTQSGLDLLDRYVKFVKDRAEIEQNYAKQLRNLSKKYSRRGIKEDQDTKLTNQQAFQEVLNELNEYAGQREQLSESMTLSICVELSRNLQELRLERKNCLCEVKKAQQNLETSFKQLEISKKRFEKEWKEAEKANQQTEKVQQDINSTKADVDKAKQHAHARVHIADESKNEYASQLQRYNKDQNSLYHSEIPSVFKKLQELEERRIRLLAGGYVQFSETEKNILPNINKCLDSIISTGRKIDEKQDTLALIEQYRSGAAPPADVEFEDYSQGVKPAASDSAPHLPKVRIKQLFKKNKVTSPDKNMPSLVEDFSRLPPDQRRRRLQDKMDDIQKELQRETEQSEALKKMKGVYEQNSQLGDPSSLQPQITQTAHNIARLRGELSKYQVQLTEAGGETLQFSPASSEYIAVLSESSVSPSDNIYECGFDEDFDVDVPIGQCKALYDFDGSSEGAVSMQVGEQLSLMDEDQGDGWVRVQRANGDVGYVPASYIKII
ncbi:thyroid hormone receptor interactor 10b isoform X2 [Megalobrama amblycephala]|uniref:thyroid hormone receptor interactor 10b isoform X2 n=1 Tax=Megalobrama amblycephala TaxID=75352 RepID=UPI0020147457|nr:thyroid hormone receptor interactor 10b isoform X2 [Megalobrama amblycephala]